VDSEDKSDQSIQFTGSSGFAALLTDLHRSFTRARNMPPRTSSLHEIRKALDNAQVQIVVHRDTHKRNQQIVNTTRYLIAYVDIKDRGTNGPPATAPGSGRNSGTHQTWEMAKNITRVCFDLEDLQIARAERMKPYRPPDDPGRAAAAESMVFSFTPRSGREAPRPWQGNGGDEDA
jgi:hypothetical protein